MVNFDMLGRIDHIGIVVQNIDQALETYCAQLGFMLNERLTVEDQQVEVAFLQNHEDVIELLAPTDDSGGVARFLEKRGEGMHHICYEVEDIYGTLDRLKAQGTQLIDEEPRQGVHGLIAFIHPKAAHGTLIELLQKEHDS